MNNFLKATLFSAAAAGVVFAGWRFVRARTPQPPGVRENEKPSTNGDFEHPGEGRDLTPQQREKLLEELEQQLGA